jgi:hypothetical protein
LNSQIDCGCCVFIAIDGKLLRGAANLPTEKLCAVNVLNDHGFA